MAIIIEEEKKSANWGMIAAAAIVVAVLFIGGYYVFFKKPELIEVIAPQSLESLSQLSQAKFEPDSVINSLTFKSLRDYSYKLELPPAGRDNPFKSF